MGPIGMGEVVVLFVLALLIFGPKKLPELGKTFGKGMAEFKRASNELKTTFQREMDNIEYETREVKGIASGVGKEINSSYYDNDDDYYSDYDYGDGAKSAATGESGTAPGGAAAGNSASGEDQGEPAEQTGEESPPEVSGVPEAEGSAAPSTQA